MTVSIWVTVVIAMISLVAGFWIGRSVNQMVEETEELVRTREEEEMKPAMVRERGRRIPLGWIIASPTSGEVRPFYEGSRCGALIQPEEGKIYAPVSGRIVRLYPMGQAMLIATDWGMEVLIKVGQGVDDFCSRYYRSRVVQNEIVTKGKLLLEFDKMGLEQQGVEGTVTVCVESGMEEKNIVVTQKEYVKTGEDLIWE